MTKSAHTCIFGSILITANKTGQSNNSAMCNNGAINNNAIIMQSKFAVGKTI